MPLWHLNTEKKYHKNTIKKKIGPPNQPINQPKEKQKQVFRSYQQGDF